MGFPMVFLWFSRSVGQLLRTSRCQQLRQQWDGHHCVLLDASPAKAGNDLEVIGHIWNLLWLVGGLEHEFYDFPKLGNIWNSIWKLSIGHYLCKFLGKYGNYGNYLWNFIWKLWKFSMEFYMEIIYGNSLWKLFLKLLGKCGNYCGNYENYYGNYVLELYELLWRLLWTL